MFHFKRFSLSFSSGASLFEVVVSIGLLAMFASTLFIALGSQLVISTSTIQSLEAISLAHEGLEAARSIRDIGWSSLATGTHGILYTNTTYGFQSTSDTASGYRRTVTVTELSANERQAVSTVFWTGPTGQQRSVSLATNISNWRNVLPPFVPRLTGDWSNLHTLGTIDLGAGVAGTGVRVLNKIVYMSGTASQANKNDFFVIDATDGANPTMLAEIQTGVGLNAVDIAGNFAYGAQDSNTNQLQVINISSSSSPYAIANFTLTGNTQVALSVAVTGTLVLVGTEQDSGPELFLVSASNPSLPEIKSSIKISADVNRINIVGDYAYLATSNSSTEFIIVNISNPNAPVIVSSANLPGNNAATGLYVNTQDQRAYLTREEASGDSPEINAYDVSNPNAPAFLGSKEFSNDIPSVFAADNLLFLSTAENNLEFQLFNATNTQQMTYITGFNFPQVGNDIAFEDNMIYIAVRSNDALRILTSQE